MKLDATVMLTLTGFEFRKQYIDLVREYLKKFDALDEKYQHYTESRFLDTVEVISHPFYVLDDENKLVTIDEVNYLANSNASMPNLLLLMRLDQIVQVVDELRS